MEGGRRRAARGTRLTPVFHFLGRAGRGPAQSRLAATGLLPAPMAAGSGRTLWHSYNYSKDMEMKALLTTLMLAVAPLLTVASAQAQSPALDRIQQAGVLKVGVKADYRPFGFLDPGGKIVGIEPDLAQDVAKRLGVKLEMIPVQSANRMEFLQQGRIDLMIATMTVNEQRLRVVGAIEPYYYAGGTSLLTRKDSGIKSWADTKGKELCGTQGAYYNRAVTEKYGAKVVAFPGTAEAQTALLNGSCVGFLQDSTLIAAMLIGGDPRWADYEIPVVVEDYKPWAIAVTKDEQQTAYGKKMHDIVVDWHKSGYLLELEKKWGLPVSGYLVEMHEKFK